MKLRVDSWRQFAEELMVESNQLVAEVPSPAFWIKSGDGTMVSELDIQIDLAARKSFSAHFPGASLLSEELGWMRSRHEHRDPNLVGVLDPIDGTESLANGATTWWVSVGVLLNGEPAAGLIHQPSTRVSFESSTVRLGPAMRRKSVGLSPDQADGASRVAQLLRSEGFETAPEPHAAEKIAAVLNGRCSSAIYIPSAKSPNWRSWDLAAAVALARQAGMILTTGLGERLTLGDLEAPRGDAWICSREPAEHAELLRVLARL